MADLLDDLINAGLEKNEATILVLLMRSGSLPIAGLIKKTRLSRTAVNASLERLTKLKFVSAASAGRQKLFTALDPKSFVHFLEEKERAIAEQKERALKLIEPLRSIGVKSSAFPKVHFFAGQDAARRALEDTLDAKEKTLRAFFAAADISEFLGSDYLDLYTKKRISAGLTLHGIRTFERDRRVQKRGRMERRYLSSKDERREVRFVGDDFTFPMTLYVYDQKILAIGTKEENFAVIIESKEINQMQRKLFEMTWRTLTIRSIGPGKSR